MARSTILVGLLLTFTAAGCAGRSAGTAGDDIAPSASIASESLAGHWRGELHETGGSLVTGSKPIDLTIAEDGTWRGTIGKAPASGTARLQKGRLVLEGAAAAPNSAPQAAYYRLEGDDQRRWGETTTTFTGWEARASVSLERAG